MIDDTEQCGSVPHTHTHTHAHTHTDGQSRAEPVRHAESSKALNKQTLQERQKGSFIAGVEGRGPLAG